MNRTAKNAKMLKKRKSVASMSLQEIEKEKEQVRAEIASLQDELDQIKGCSHAAEVINFASESIPQILQDRRESIIHSKARG